MKTYAVCLDGKVIYVSTSNILPDGKDGFDVIELDEPIDPNQFYLNDNVLKPIPKQLYSWCVFNYSTGTWDDPRTLDQIKEQKWTSTKADRDALEFGGFIFEDNPYDSDQVSQGRIFGAVLAGLPQIWTLANNTTVSLSAEQLKSLYVALQMHVAIAHERGRIAREAIQAATTKEQVEAIVF